MQIAFLTVGDPARLTGGYLYHRELFARLRARGVAVDQIVASGAGLEEQLAAAPALGARLDPRRYDAIVVDALARAAAAPWLDEWRRQRPLVAMVHELPSVAGGGTGGEEEREAPLLRADRLVAVSDDGARILAERGVEPGRIVVAPGGLDRLRALSPQPSALSPQPSAVLCVAQWIERKGLLDLAAAWALAARPGWRISLVGEDTADPAYAARVRAALAAAPPGSVELRGPLSDDQLAAAYAGAAIFAMPSRYEGYGIAYAEAMAHGLPVLACAVGPVPALLGPEAGLLVPPSDPAALAAALGRLMDDPALRARMSAAASARAAQLPTWDDTATAFLRAVEGAITSRLPA
jgi:glycosyltransferase involved in cell wall biosynthesis